MMLQHSPSKDNHKEGVLTDVWRSSEERLFCQIYVDSESGFFGLESIPEGVLPK